MALEFLVLEVAPETESKINSKHGVTSDDVADALENLKRSIWDDDSARGRRLYVYGQAGKRLIFVVLRPIDESAGQWELVTAYPDTDP